MAWSESGTASTGTRRRKSHDEAMLHVATPSIQKPGLRTRARPRSRPAGVASRTDSTVRTQKRQRAAQPRKRCRRSNRSWWFLRNDGQAKPTMVQHSADSSQDTTMVASESTVASESAAASESTAPPPACV
ncbi:hypothetical protein G6O67_006247 [Ophiocordyceps sinensis]|uniref:Uncharacterized protein n=1 Tax=Ophiocordyceps sinensis TaxID=72228 RepID=A0A8H4LVU0_9HYPO|nr:hypothetical protein G6O67_006247 [Ophiocordyceps sinensis]